MYKLMVVDDENLAIESVKYIVKNDIENILVTNNAKSGREAIEKARLDRPDIVLMDIRMPGINGLEAIQEIKKVHNNVKFVIVSAFEYFEFAQQAVELGVNDYLTKPVNKIRLIETLAKVTKQLDEEKSKFDKEIETREKIEKMLSVVESSFIYSLLLSQGQKVNITKYKELVDIKEKLGYIFIIMFNSNDDLGDELGNSVKNQAFYNYFRDTLKYKCKAIVGPVMLDRVVVYVSQKVTDEYQQRVQAINFFENIVSKLKTKYNMDFTIGIGGVQQDEDIIISYQEALKALNYNSGECVTHIDDVAFNLSNANYEILADEQRLINLIEKGDDEASISLLNDIFNKYPNFFQAENIRNRLVELMVVAHRIAIECGIENDSYLEYSKYINQILECKDSSCFERMCIGKIRYITRIIRKKKRKTISAIVYKANKIIDERFMKELTLDDISKELCISPQYFSRLYKDETGINFIEQLTKKRIENAKKLIEKGQYSIKEICYMSGYSDPNYFSRLFKKHEGVSPTLYLKQQ